MPDEVRRVPEGYHSITPHIVVKGVVEAIDFYKRAFGAEEVSCRRAPDGSVMHAEVKVGDSSLMLNDEYPDYGSLSPLSLNGTAVTLHIYVEDVDAAFQQALDAGAEVLFPLGDQFWGDRYGVVRDPYGHKWSLSSHVEDVSEEECDRRAAAFFGGN